MNKQEHNDAKLRDAVERLPRIEGDSSVVAAADARYSVGCMHNKASGEACPGVVTAEASARI